MTRYTCQKHRVAYNAFCNGYRIEMRNPETGTWSETTEPCWLPDWEYRVIEPASVNVEDMIAQCVPCGILCDPQAVADAIRSYCAERGVK
jgi:hypothetical protein